VVYRCTSSTLLSDACVWSEVCGVVWSTGVPPAHFSVMTVCGLRCVVLVWCTGVPPAHFSVMPVSGLRCVVLVWCTGVPPAHCLRVMSVCGLRCVVLVWCADVSPAHFSVMTACGLRCVLLVWCTGVPPAHCLRVMSVCGLRCVVWSEVCTVGVVYRCTSSTLLRATPTMRCRPTSTESWIGFCQSVTDTARRLKTFRHLQTTTSVQVAAACVL